MCATHDCGDGSFSGKLKNCACTHTDAHFASGDTSRRENKCDTLAQLRTWISRTGWEEAAGCRVLARSRIFFFHSFLSVVRRCVLNAARRTPNTRGCTNLCTRARARFITYEMQTARQPCNGMRHRGRRHPSQAAIEFPNARMQIRQLVPANAVPCPGWLLLRPRPIPSFGARSRVHFPPAPHSFTLRLKLGVEGQTNVTCVSTRCEERRRLNEATIAFSGIWPGIINKSCNTAGYARLTGIILAVFAK